MSTRPGRVGPGGGGPRPAVSHRGVCVQVLAARDLLPGALVWPNGAEEARVLAVLPGVDVVTVIIDSAGVLGCFSCAGDDGYRTCGRGGGHDCNAHARAYVLAWHQERGMRCCPDDGPYCCTSVAYAYEQLRRDGSALCVGGRP